MTCHLTTLAVLSRTLMVTTQYVILFQTFFSVLTGFLGNTLTVINQVVVLPLLYRNTRKFIVASIGSRGSVPV